MTAAIETPQKKSSAGKVIGFIGCGCLGLILIGCIVGGLMFFGITKMMKNTDAYRDTLAAVQSNPAAVAALGEPIEPGMFVMGSVNSTNGAETVDIQIPVSGPNGSGTIYVTGSKDAGTPAWNYERRELIVEGQAEGIQID